MYAYYFQHNLFTQVSHVDCNVSSSPPSPQVIPTSSTIETPFILRSSSVGRRKAEIIPPRYSDKARSCNCINTETNGERGENRVMKTKRNVSTGKEMSLIRWFSDNSLNQRWVQARQKVANAYRQGLEPKELLKYKLKTHVSMTNLTKENNKSINQQQHQGNEVLVPSGWMEGYADCTVLIDYTSSFKDSPYSVRKRFRETNGGKFECFLGD